VIWEHSIGAPMIAVSILLAILSFSCQQIEAPSPEPEAPQRKAAETTRPSVAPDPVLDRLHSQAMASDGALDKLVELCDDIGNRLSGSPQLDQAIAWAKDRMEREGLANVRTQPVMVPRWVRGDEWLRLDAPQVQNLPMLGLGMSIATPPKGIKAEVVVVKDFDGLAALGEEGVRGKIVLFNAPFTTYGDTVKYRSKGASEAAKLGAVAALVRSVSPKSLQSPHTGALGYEADWKIPSAAVTVEDAERMQRWQDRGRRTDVSLYMEAQLEAEAPSANVIGEIRGSSRPDEIVVIGGHLDSWDVGQGAQDDGAGVVVSMEAARLIAALDEAPKRTIRVVLFTNEENGLAGAKAYASEHAEAERHFAAIEADIGAGTPLRFSYKLPEGMDEEAFSHLKEELVSVSSRLAAMGMHPMEAGYAGADVNPLVEVGALGLGLRMDTTGYWPIHHTHADTIDKIDPENLQRNTAAMAMMAWALAGLGL
jgi:carboxypeptidase Q